MPAPEHVYRVAIQAPPARIWGAITDGAATERYYYGTRVASSWLPGDPVIYTYPDGTIAADGRVLEFVEDRRLAMTFHARWDPEIEAEGPVTMVWEIEPDARGGSVLTVTTTGAGPKTTASFGGGIATIVSGLKALVERREDPEIAGEPGAA